MSIATSASLRAGGVGVPKFDIRAPSLVLYAPLWRPDMVGRGGRIENGTGTCTGSPLHLAIGSNTVAVTIAGTLIVYMPEGGTVASGTMTVTGSPVTVSAGIATTITTTGATGNITVTSSNIIRSKDNQNRAMTITGATWGSTGRTCDGNDDLISIPAHSTINTLSALTIIAWTNPTNYGGASVGRIITKASSTNVDGWMLRFSEPNILFSVGFGIANLVVKGPGVTTGSWQMITVTWDGTVNSSGVHIYNNLTEISYGAPTEGQGTRTSDNANNLIIGNTSDGIRGFNGKIGEALVYNTVLGSGVWKNIRQGTKWRYGV